MEKQVNRILYDASQFFETLSKSVGKSSAKLLQQSKAKTESFDNNTESFLTSVPAKKTPLAGAKILTPTYVFQHQDLKST